MAYSEGILTQDSLVSPGIMGSDLVQERIKPGVLQARSENQPEASHQKLEPWNKTVAAHFILQSPSWSSACLHNIRSNRI